MVLPPGTTGDIQFGFQMGPDPCEQQALQVGDLYGHLQHVALAAPKMKIDLSPSTRLLLAPDGRALLGAV